MIAPCPSIRRGFEAMVPTVPGIGQRDGGALEIAGAELARAGARHQVVEGGQVLREVQGAGVLDVRHQQAARAVLAGDIDREPEIDLLPHDAERLARRFPRKGVIERRISLHRAHDGPADEVGVGNLALADQRRGAG